MKSMFDAKQRFSLRKLTIGVVSVLLGLTFLTNAQTVKADEQNNQSGSQASAVTGQESTGSTSEETQEKDSPVIKNTNTNSNISLNKDDAQNYVNNERQNTMKDYSSTNVDHAKGYNYLYANPNVDPGVIFAGGPQNWGHAADANQNFKVTKEAQKDGTTKWTVTFLPDCQTIFRSTQNHSDNGSFAFFLSKDYNIVKDKNGSYFQVYEAVTNGSRTFKGSSFKVIAENNLDNFDHAGQYAPYSIYTNPIFNNYQNVPDRYYNGNFAREIDIFTANSTPEERSRILNDLSLYMDSYGIANWDYYNRNNRDTDLQTGIGVDIYGNGSSHLQKAFKMDANNANKNQNRNMWGNTNPQIDVADFGWGFFFRSQGSAAMNDNHGGTMTVTFYTRPSKEKVATYSGLVALQNEGTPQNADGNATRSHEAATNTAIRHNQSNSNGVSDGRIVTADSKDAASAEIKVVIKNETKAKSNLPSLNYTITKASMSDVTGNKDSSQSSVQEQVAVPSQTAEKDYYVSEAFDYQKNTDDMQKALNQALNPNSSKGSKYLTFKINNLADLNKAGVKAVANYDSANKQYVITVANADTDNLKYPALAPSQLTVVNDKDNLSQNTTATDKVTGLIKAANSEVKDVAYNDTTKTVTLTYEDKTTNTLSYDDVVAQVPTKTMVFQDPGKDTFTVTDNRAAEISNNITTANQTANLAVNVDQTNGSATVTRTSTKGNVKQTATLTPAQTIINIPNPVIVGDKTNITDAEKQKVVKNLKSVTPSIADSFTTDKVLSDGTSQVSFKDGSKDQVIDGKYTVVQSQHQEIQAPTSLVWVKDETNLTSEDLSQIAKLYKDANDGATDVKFNSNGVGVTITYNDGTSKTYSDIRANQNAIDFPGRVFIPVGKKPNEEAFKDAYSNAFQKSIDTKSGIDSIDYSEGITVDQDGNIQYEINYVDKDTGKTTHYFSGILDNAYTTVKINHLVKVSDPNNLSEADKQAIEAELTNDNPSVAFDWNHTNFADGRDNKSTLAFSKGCANLEVNNSDLFYGESIAPSDKTPVGDPDNLTKAQQDAIINKVVKANSDRGATSATIDQNNGNVVVTYDDTGISQTIPIADTIVRIPERVLVSNKANDWNNPDYTLSDQEKAQVKANVENLNPGYTAAVNNDGSVTLTKDGASATLTSDQTILRLPKRTVVKDKTQLTDDEKSQVLEAIKKINSDVSNTDAKQTIADDGSATLTFSDNGPILRNIPGDLLVYQDAKLNKPTTLTPVVDKGNLTPDEISQIIQNVKDANKKSGTTYLTNVQVTKNDQGKYVVSANLPNGKTETLSIDDVSVTIPLRTVVKNKGTLASPVYTLSDDEVKREKAAFLKDNPNINSDQVAVHRNGNITVYDQNNNKIAKITSDKTIFGILNKTAVKKQSALDQDEQTAVSKVVSQGNEHVDMTKTTIGTDGTASDMAKVSFNDGTRPITVSGQDLTSQIVNDVVYPFNLGSKTLVNDPAKLTDYDKSRIKNQIMDDNPQAAQVDFKTDKSGQGVVELTYPDKTTTDIPVSDVVAQYPEKTQIKLSDRQNDPNAALTDPQKELVRNAVLAANPDATVTVKDDGSVSMTQTITYDQPVVEKGQEHNPDAQVITNKQTLTVTTQIAAPDTVINVPDQIPVADPSNLTGNEKQQVFNAIVKANPKTQINLADPITTIIAANGDAKLGFMDGSPKAVLTDLVKQKHIADSQILNVPSQRVLVKNKNKLSDNDKTAIENAVKAVNRYDGQDPDVVINPDGTISVEYSDKSSLNLPVKVGDLTAQYPERQIVTDKVDPDAIKAIKSAFAKANPDLKGQVQVNDQGYITYTGTSDNDPSVFLPHTMTIIKVGPKVLVNDVDNLTDTDKANVTKIVEDDNKDPLNNNQDNFNPITNSSYETDGLHITYPAGQGQDVVIPYSDLVYSNKPVETTKPIAKPIVVVQGGSITPKDGIANTDKLPKDSGYTWKDNQTPGTNTPGKKTGTVVVTDHNGKNPVEVSVPVYVIGSGKPITVDQNHTLNQKDAKSTIDSNSGLPDNTTYTWKKAPDTTTPGDGKDGVVTVTIPDEGSVDVNVKVNVKPSQQPAPKPSDGYVEPTGTDTITKTVGDKIDPKDGIGNSDKLPTGTTYTWGDGKGPDMTKPGTYHGTVEVDEKVNGHKPVSVPVTIVVKSQENPNPQPQPQPTPTPAPAPKDDKIYTPIAKPITVNKGDTPDSNQGIANKDKLPNGTTYTWKDGQTPDTSVPGDTTGTIVVTYPDGTKTTVTVPIHVIDTTKPLTIKKGHDLTDDDARKAVDPERKLPDNTGFTWKTKPDTSTPGDKKGQVEITYPDGTKSDVSVVITVRPLPAKYHEENTKHTQTKKHAKTSGVKRGRGGMNKGNGKTSQPITIKEAKREPGLTNNQKPTTTRVQKFHTLPQTGQKHQGLAALGLAIMSLASLMMLDRKKKKN